MISRAIAAAFYLAIVFARAPFASAAPGDVARAMLPNGLQVVAVRDTLAPVVTTVVVYKVGADEDPPGLPGMAHAQEHMMFRGSPGLSAAQLGEISAAMGGDSNAFTESTDTQYYYTVPMENLDIALQIEATRMRDVLDAADGWAQERGAIEQEVSRDRSDPQYLVTAAVRAAMLRGTPYAGDGLGTRESFDAMTAAQLKAFYDAWYSPDDAVVVAAGDLDPAKTIALMERRFGSIPNRTHPQMPAVLMPPPVGSTLTVQGDQTHPSIFVAYRMPGYVSSDYAAGVVLADVLSDQRSDLHWFPSNWAEGIGFWNETFPSAGIAFAVADIPAGGDAARMVKVLENNVDDYVIDGFPRADVEAAKRRAVVQLEAARGSVRGLALAWAQAVAVEGRGSPDDDVAAINKVTVDDVNRVAALYLKSADAVIGTLLPAAAGSASATSGGAAANESVAVPISRTAPALPSWALPATKVALPLTSLSPVDEILPNGLRLIVVPETASDTVIVRGSVAGEPSLETPLGQEGVSSVLDEIFNEGPADVIDEDWVAELDDTGADVSAGRDFSLLSLASDFDRTVRLLADNELRPNITPTFFSKRRSAIATFVADQLASPDGRTAQALDSSLFPSGDPLLRLPTKDTIDGVTFANVDEYYKRAFRPDLTTIVVVGNVTASAARDVIEKYFNGWRSEGPKPPLALPRVPLNAPHSSVVPAEGHLQDDVILAEIVGVNRSDPDYYALQVANHVLAGGDQATWLYRDVRQEAGLVYSIDSALAADNAGRSIFSVEYGCDPANVGRAKDIVLRDLRQLQGMSIGPDDIRRAKLLLLRHVPLNEQSEELIAATLLARAQAGLPLDEPMRAARRYLQITAPQVRAAFAKWIRPDGFVQVVEGPPPQ